MSITSDEDKNRQVDESPTHYNQSKYAGFSELARILGTLEAISRPQGYRRQHIHMWWHRRRTTGFPEKRSVVIEGKTKDLFDVTEVIEWKKSYVPYSPATNRHNRDCVDTP